MKRTEGIWVDPASACAMWIELWTAWYTVALTWWLPKPAFRGGVPARPLKATGRARLQIVNASAVQDHSNGAVHGGIDRQAMNGYGAG